MNRRDTLLIGTAILLLVVTLGYLVHARRSISDGLVPVVERVDRPGDRSGDRIVLVFQPEDCSSSLAVLARLNGLERRARGRVRGLVVGMERDALSELAEGFDIRFPLAGMGQRAAGRLLRVLGYQRTPLVLGLDARGRLSWAGAPGTPVVEHALARAEKVHQ